MVKKKGKEKDTTRWQRTAMGLLMALIMIGSVVAMMMQF
ncbi:MAG: hypothetical protein C5S38_10085 [Candidatus Methanophagaceae archaeon]|jgi:hypothetical protein|nr:MAG: hypothetical protein C5S38_10085 [Methanophagales archaeon]KAF5426116.1 hypothetical protein C5S39_15245 [Methanophagales archaeon]KAF5426119.1 hypothetical protein C5S39_15260 [Methanophagales archaeon]KAF5431862.1 hypothetical protein C5S36_09680 [Methanophagales archaeon]